MTKAEIAKTRAMAQKDEIWSKHLESMSKKSVIKRLIKYLPVSTDLAEAIQKDEKTPQQIKQEEGDVFETTASPVEALNAELSES
jgi:recombination protein RecT